MRKDSYYDGVRDALDKVYSLLVGELKVKEDAAFNHLEKIEQSLLLYPKKIKISQKSLDEFKAHVKEICGSPSDVEQEFESLYGYGNAPKEPTEKDWLNLLELYRNEDLYSPTI